MRTRKTNRVAGGVQGGGDGGNDATARAAWTLLLQLLRAEQHVLLEVWSDFDLTSAQGELLCSLEPGSPATMVSLARMLHCHDSNVTGLVDKLEERKWIERQAMAGDRRVKLIALTKAGEKLRERLLLRLSDPLPFIARMSATDQGRLLAILRRAAGSAE